MLSIQTNVAALQSAQSLNKSQAAYQNATQQLSSGMRINNAADDAAGFAISTRMNANIDGMSVAQRNVSSAISLTQAASSTLGQVNDMLQQMNQIATQAANGTLGTSDRAALDKSFQQLVQEITRQVGASNFNGVNLLDGSTASVTFQVGAGTTGNDTVNVSMSNLTTLGAIAGSLDVTTAANATAAMTALKTDIATVTSASADMGAAQTRLTAISSQLTADGANLTEAKGRITDADFAQQTMKMTQADVLQQAGESVLSKVNQSAQQILKLLQ